MALRICETRSHCNLLCRGLRYSSSRMPELVLDGKRFGELWGLTYNED